MLYTWPNTNLKELIHGHWGSICAPEDKVRIAVIKDEIELPTEYKITNKRKEDGK